MLLLKVENFWKQGWGFTSSLPRWLAHESGPISSRGEKAAYKEEQGVLK